MIKIVNRGYMIVRPKQPFLDWANKIDEDFTDLVEIEPNVYLIEDDFYEEEPLVKKHFKKLFENELLSVSEDKNSYPEITEENFIRWFDLSFGTSVFDVLKSDLKAE